MSLVARCPKCHSGFEVSADQLRLHDGLVRCGQCSHVFDGYANLQVALPTLTRKVDVPVQAPTTSASDKPSVVTSSTPRVDETPPPVQAASFLAQRIRISDDASTPQDAAAELGVARIVPRPRVEAESQQTQQPQQAVSATTARPSLSATRHPSSQRTTQSPQEPVLSIRPTPRFSLRATQDDASDTASVRVMGEARVRGEDPSSPGRREPDFMEEPTDSGWRLPAFVWLALSVVLLMSLALQVTVYFRNDIATALPMSRGILTQLCQRVGCEVSPVRRIERIVIIGSALQQGEQNAAQKAAKSMPYVLKLTLQNRNDAPQPWPSLLLTLNDASSTVVIRKVLAPDQYLPPSMVNQPFAARQEVALELPMVVEGHMISGFEVRRFFP